MYRYLLPTVLVLFLSVSMAHIGTAGADEDSSSEELDAIQTIRAGPDAAPFIAELCSDDAAVDQRRARCDVCPDDAPSQSGRLTVRRVFHGDFSGDGTRRAVAAVNGCAPGYSEGHAAALFEATDDGWKLIDYHQGMNVSSCRRIDFESARALLCVDRSVGDSTTTSRVFSLTANTDGWQITDIDEMFDRSTDCGSTGEIARRLDSIYTGELTDSDAPVVGLLVQSRMRTANTDEPDGCQDYDVASSHQLRLFRPGDDGLQPIDVDDPCAHPQRAQILRKFGACR